jgi:hypothetical protein
MSSIANYYIICHFNIPIELSISSVKTKQGSLGGRPAVSAEKYLILRANVLVGMASALLGVPKGRDTLHPLTLHLSSRGALVVEVGLQAIDRMDTGCRMARGT